MPSAAKSWCIRFAVSPAEARAVILSRCGAHRLVGPRGKFHPVGALAGFGGESGAELPIGALAGSGSRAGTSAKLAGFDDSEPVGALAGSASHNCCRRYLRTVSRSMPSSRAIRRCAQPCACNESIDCTFAILSRFAIAGLLLRQWPLGSPYVKSSSAQVGWFSPADRWLVMRAD